MNKLPLHKRVQIINLLVEGSSLRAASRIADVSINAVTKLLVDVGRSCEKFHNEAVQNVNSQRIQVDEIWSFVYSKEKTYRLGWKMKPETFGPGRPLMQISSWLYPGWLRIGT